MLFSLTLAVLVAFLAHRARLLTSGGALAATVVGTACVLAGWRWVALLAFFFATSNLLSTWRGAEREMRSGGVIAKGGSDLADVALQAVWHEL